jgi:hypothetical protein
LFITVRQNFPSRRLADIPTAVTRELDESGIAPRGRIAIGVGSRGISNIAIIVRAVVAWFQSRGAHPFIFPAMGSHGAANAEGQAQVLAHYGIDESSMGCPVVSTFDIVSLGHTDSGIEVFAGRDAWESDGVFVINRVKWHTSFEGDLESGPSKMLALGVGKIAAAETCHGHARHMGMPAVIRSVAGQLLASGKVLGGLAILEDAYHDTAQVATLRADRLIDREIKLLALTKSWTARIPVPALDILIVDEIGKNISGTGMDLKVVNRGVQGQYSPYVAAPRIERIFIRSLSELSYGNAHGMGLADVIHDRVLDHIDRRAGLANARSAGSLAAARTPLHFPTDRECLDLLQATVGKFDPKDVTIGWIRNTLELGTMAFSENLADQFPGTQNKTAPAFDRSGNWLRFEEIF